MKDKNLKIIVAVVIAVAVIYVAFAVLKNKSPENSPQFSPSETESSSPEESSSAEPSATAEEVACNKLDKSKCTSNHKQDRSKTTDDCCWSITSEKCIAGSGSCAQIVSGQGTCTDTSCPYDKCVWKCS